MFKPASSKAGNSEQYIICLGYKGRSNVLTHGHLEKFRASYGPQAPPFPFLPLATIPESFLTQLINCATKFAKHQVQYVYLRILETFNNYYENGGIKVNNFYYTFSS